MIEIVKAPPYATVQDRGFPLGRAWGLPSGGAMDPLLLELANTTIGNPPDAPAIEWALGPGTVRFERPTRISVLGLAELAVDDQPLEPPAFAFTAPAGAAISIAPGPFHRFSYLAAEGGFDVPAVLGSRSTYLPGAIGGHQGRRLQTGDRLRLGSHPPRSRAESGVCVTAIRREPPSPGDLTIRVTRGPQWERFDQPARAAFFAGRYTIAADSDRMGYRLLGPVILPRERATLPSEAACPGAVQIPDSGEPIVLMPDGPTVGGYPKLAVVVRADLRLLAQSGPERGIHFREVSLEEARAAAREDPLGLGALERGSA